MGRLGCCSRSEAISIDFDEHDKVMTYSGLESCILSSCSYNIESGGGTTTTTTDSLDDDDSSYSSSKEAFGSSPSSHFPVSGKQEGGDEEEEQHMLRDWEVISRFNRLCVKGKAPVSYSMHASDVETMRERFAKLLLGEDVSGGVRGIGSALALSNAIINLSATVFGEFWKLEPLSEEKKGRWQREMDWLLSPTNYMVELVPSKQNGANGRTLEIMTPQARSDVHVNLPALRKLDSMLLEVLDSMVGTEFWYAEGGSRAEGRSHGSGARPSKKWWLPSPRVPEFGLSASQRKKLGFQGKFVHQVLKAAKAINEQILLQMPIPAAVKDALPKSAKASLGEEVYMAITAESVAVEKFLLSLNLSNEHSVLDIVNRLEGAVLAWKQIMAGETIKRSPMRYPWHFARDNGSEVEKIEVWVERAKGLLHLLKDGFPNLPQTFIDVTKVQYNKDVGHSIVEAYSRVLVGLSFSILSRMGDILQEDDLKKQATPIATLKFDFSSDVYLSGITETPPGHIRRSLIDQISKVDGRRACKPSGSKPAEEILLDVEARIVTVEGSSPYRNLARCYGRESCTSSQASSSP